MRNCTFIVVVIAFAFTVAGCRPDVKEAAPYQNSAGLTFEVDDGTGVYYSKTGTYVPVYCGTTYPARGMDIGQGNFDAIAGLVTAGDIWSAQVVAIPQCQVIDVARPGEYYKFEIPGRSVSLKVGQCQRIDSAHEPYLKAIRQLVRSMSDRQTLKVRGECLAF